MDRGLGEKERRGEQRESDLSQTGLRLGSATLGSTFAWAPKYDTDSIWPMKTQAREMSQLFQDNIRLLFGGYG